MMMVMPESMIEVTRPKFSCYEAACSSLTWLACTRFTCTFTVHENILLFFKYFAWNILD